MARILPPLLGVVSADLKEVFSDGLRAYAQQLRDRKRSDSGPKVINDPIWRTVRVEPWEVLILDSPVVQRLRGIRQLGLASYVYPGAGYSRFEHSIGVLHQTQRFIDAINRNARTENPGALDPIQPADQVMLRLAALLHDIGHGFLSHVSERAMLRVRLDGGHPATDLVRIGKKHFGTSATLQLAEVLAALIVQLEEFVDLLELAKVPRWSDYEELSDHLAHLIVGTTKFKTRPFLSEIVSGVVDADKLDYMARDCYMAGLPMPVDVERLLEKIHVVSIAASKAYASHAQLRESEAIQVFAVQLSGGRTVEELLLSRVLLYEKLYHHQKVRALEGMVENAIDLLAKSEPSFQKLSTFLSYSDAEFLAETWRNAAAPEPPETERARKILLNVTGRRAVIRAFVFGTSLIAEPSVSNVDEPDPATREQREQQRRSEAWRKLVPLTTRNRDSSAVEFRERLIQRAQKYLRAAGQEALSRTLDVSSVVVDLPDPQGIAAKTKFWVKQRNGVVPYSDVARVDRWMEAYEAQKRVGFVHCQPEHANAVHLAFRDLVFEECGLIFDARSMIEAKLNIGELSKFSKALIAEGIQVRPVSDEPAQLPSVIPLAQETEVQLLFGSRLADLAARFQNYRGSKGPSIDVHKLTRWLVQFDKEQVHYAMTLLESVRFWDRPSLVDALVTGVQRLDPEIVDSAVFVPFGGGDKSSHHIGYLIPDVRAALPERRIELVSSVNDIKKPGNIVFFDDISASGKQGATGVRQLFGEAPGAEDLEETVVNPARPDVIEFLKESSLTFLFITGHRDGLDHVVAAARNAVGHDRVSGVLVVPDELDCFQPASRIFLDASDAEKAKALFRAKGERALQDKAPKWSAAKISARALGYGGRSLLTVFYYNTPSATLTALWKQCDLPGFEWTPLFLRRTAQSVPIQAPLDLK